MDIKTNMLIKGGLLTILIAGGAFGLYQFNASEKVEIDPLSKLLEKNMMQESASTDSKKADFFGNANNNNDHSNTVQSYLSGNNPTIPPSVQTCMNSADTPASANLGILSSDLSMSGLTTLVDEKFSQCTAAEKSKYFSGDTDISQGCTDGIKAFLTNTITDISPVFGSALANNQIHWDWESNSRKYIFYPYKGEDRFWYCYFKEETNLFKKFLKTGFNSEDNTLYYTPQNPDPEFPVKPIVSPFRKTISPFCKL